jgi:negative regulator of replication initiation
LAAQYSAASRIFCLRLSLLASWAQGIGQSAGDYLSRVAKISKHEVSEGETSAQPKLELKPCCCACLSQLA